LKRPVVLVSIVVTGACSSAPAVSNTVAAVAADSVAWVAGTPLPSGRDHHGTFITSRGNNAWLWIVGGNDYKSVMADTWRTRINADGSIGAWEAGNALPAKRAGMGVATNERFVILSGGQDSALRKQTDVFVAAIRDDGTLGEWIPGGSLPSPRFHHASLIDGQYLYVVGGLERASSTSTVFRGRIGANGTITQWDSLQALPHSRSHQAMFVHGRYMYMVGGLDGNPAGQNTPLADVIRAPIGPDGNLGAWEEISKMPHAYGTHASSVYGNAVWLFGGVEDNARFVDVVLRAPFTADGRLGAWKQLAKGLPAARSHVHQVPIYKGRAYSASGSNRRVVTPDVQIGTFMAH
jgi:hypothetical protein